MTCDADQNAGLYGERVGALHIVSASTDAAKRIKSQVALLQRAEISSPPAWGARVMATILNNPAMFDEWKSEIQVMSGRIIDMRKALRDELERLGTPGGWEHITKQIGTLTLSFSCARLSPALSLLLASQAHADGRLISYHLGRHVLVHRPQPEADQGARRGAPCLPHV